MRIALAFLLLIAGAAAAQNWSSSEGAEWGGNLGGDASWSVVAARTSCGDPPSTNLRVWLDGENIDGLGNATLANNDPITTWEDLGSLGDDPTQPGAATLKPTFIASCTNGKPCVRFDGGDFLRATTVANYAFLHDGTGATIISVVKTSASAVGTIVATANGAAAARGVGHRINTTFRASYFMSDGAALQVNANGANNTVSTAFFNVMTSSLVSAATDLTLSVDGVSVATATGAAFSAGAATSALTVGATSANNVNLTGDVLQVLIYAGAPDAGEIALAESWIECTYGNMPVARNDDVEQPERLASVGRSILVGPLAVAVLDAAWGHAWRDAA
jgi:hypothetical protein